MTKDFKVVGYMPAWKTGKLTKIRYDVLTHVIYSFAYPDEDNDIVIPNIDKVNDIIGMAHKAKVKVLLSIGGWNDFGSSYKEFMINSLKDEENMKTIIDNAVKTAYDLSFDGIDINWGNLAEDVSCKDEIYNFTKYISEKLHEREMTLSLSVFGNYDQKTNDALSYEFASCTPENIENVDWVNIICYEEREGVRNTNTNLKMEDLLHNSVKIPNEKTVMGVPFFVNVSLMAYQNDIKENKNELMDDENNSEIITCGREIYCVADDEFKSKVEWAKRNTIGLNVWEVTQDFSDKEQSLLTKISEVIGNIK